MISCILHFEKKNSKSFQMGSKKIELLSLLFIKYNSNTYTFIFVKV